MYAGDITLNYYEFRIRNPVLKTGSDKKYAYKHSCSHVNVIA